MNRDLVTLLIGHPLPFNDGVFLVLAGLILWVVKFLGYFAAGRWLRVRYPEVSVHPVVFALTRALLGVVVGVAYYAIAFPEPTWRDRNPSPLPWYGTLTWLRLAEWIAVLWLFFGRHIGWPSWPRIGTHAVAGTAFSVGLDLVVSVALIPAAFAAIAAA